jgi:hypothetical protein
MDQKTLLVIFLLILISSQLWNIVWDMGKSALYLVIILLLLTYIDPNTADTIKKYGQRILGLDSKLITESLSNASTFILGVFGRSPKIILEESNTIITNVKAEMFGESTDIQSGQSKKTKKSKQPKQPKQGKQSKKSK